MVFVCVCVEGMVGCSTSPHALQPLSALPHSLLQHGHNQPPYPHPHCTRASPLFPIYAPPPMPPPRTHTHHHHPTTPPRPAGGGAYKYSDLFRDRLGVVLEKEDEMSCLVAGCNFLLKAITHEAFTFEQGAPNFVPTNGVCVCLGVCVCRRGGVWRGWEVLGDRLIEVRKVDRALKS